MYPKPYQVMNNYTKNGGLRGAYMNPQPSQAIIKIITNSWAYMNNNISQHYQVIKTMSGLEVTLGPI